MTWSQRLLLPIWCGSKMHITDESFKDTCVDVINYMVLLAAYLKDKEENKGKGSPAP